MVQRGFVLVNQKFDYGNVPLLSGYVEGGSILAGTSITRSNY